MDGSVPVRKKYGVSGKMKIGILGGGVSGLAAAKLTEQKNGSFVILTDSDPSFPEKVTECDGFVVSPGFRVQSPLYQAALKTGKMFISEMEYGFRHFEGTVIAMKGSGVSATFTVRRVYYGVGVERVFPVHSPNVAKVEVIRHGRVRRSKLYYLRDRVGKAAKVKEQIR